MFRFSLSHRRQRALRFIAQRQERNLHLTTDAEAAPAPLLSPRPAQCCLLGDFLRKALQLCAGGSLWLQQHALPPA